MRSTPFTRPTLIAAIELLEQHSQARFNQVVLRLGLEDEITSSTSLSVAKKCDLLGRIVVQRAEDVLQTVDGRMSLGEAVIRQAAQLAQQDAPPPCKQPSREAFPAMDTCSSGMTTGATPLFAPPCPTRFNSLKPTTRCIVS